MQTVASSPLVIPQAVWNSTLMQQGGFAVFEGLPDAPTLSALRAEAREVSHGAVRSEILESDGTEWRGGHPARRFHNAAGGSVQNAFYNESGLCETLHGLVGLRVRPTGGQGTFTYYSSAGDHLALHRDVDACDLTMITCLEDSGDPNGAGGLLVAYPERALEPLSAIRQAPDQGAFGIRLHPGQTMILLGGIVPHLVLPVLPGQHRIVSLLCFEVLA
jgi:hypothetical protein